MTDTTTTAPTQASPEPGVPAEVPPAPRAIRALVTALAIVVLVTALIGAAIAAFVMPSVVWTALGFELVALVAGVFALMSGRGRFRDGFGLALLFYAGCVLTVAVFGNHLALRPSLLAAIEQGSVPAFMGDALKLVILVRLAIAAALAALAALAVLSRNRASWGWVVRGALLGLPIAVVGGWFAVGNASAMLGSEVGGVLYVVRVIVMLLGGLGLIVLAGLSGHCLIRAFELGRPDAK